MRESDSVLTSGSYKQPGCWLAVQQFVLRKVLLCVNCYTMACFM